MSAYTGPLVKELKCSPMAQKRGAQSQVNSYQRLKNVSWYLLAKHSALSVSRVKWDHSGKGIVPSIKPRFSSYWKRNLRVALDNGHKIYLYLSIYIYVCVCVCVCVCVRACVCVCVLYWGLRVFEPVNLHKNIIHLIPEGRPFEIAHVPVTKMDMIELIARRLRRPWNRMMMDTKHL